jgi:hypothetical protein
MANAGGIIIHAPVFFGKGDKQGSSPEDFIAQVENLRDTQAWGEPETAKAAITYLNGDARSWFFDALTMECKVDRDFAKTNYTAFRVLFVQEYFALKTTFDLTVDWHNLKQMDKEPVGGFANRVSIAMSRYSSLFTLPGQRAVTQTAILASAAAVLQRIPAADNQRVNAAPDMLAAANLYGTTHNNAAEDTRDALFTDLGIKLLAAGVRDPKMRELVSRQHKLGTPYRQLKVLMNDLEATHINKKEPAVPPPPNLNGNGNGNGNGKRNGASKFNEVSDYTGAETQEEIDAVLAIRAKAKAGGQGGRGRGGGRGANRGGQTRGGTAARGGGHAPTTPATQGDWASRAHLVCTYCTRNGHTEDTCFQKHGFPEGHPRNRANSVPGGNSITVAANSMTQGNGQGWQ